MSTRYCRCLVVDDNGGDDGDNDGDGDGDDGVAYPQTMA